MLILAEKIFTVLLVGNTIVAKPSPFTPLGTLMTAKLWKDVVPPGVVNILAGDDEVGQAMVTHPTTRMISFTGSVAAGKKIAAAAAPDLKNLLFELGGNDAAIVLDDVDVKKVAPRIYGSAFGGVGQICAATKRVYVHESIYDSMVDELANLAREQTESMGPLSTRPQYERVKMLVEDALEHGGKAVTGGEPSDGPGYFYPATIMTDVGQGVRIVDEEQFGPVLPVIAFSDVDWAIEQANSTEYGLCGSVWTRDIERGEQLGALPRVRHVVGEPAHRGRAGHPVRRREVEWHRTQQRSARHRRVLRAEDDHRLQGQGPRLSEAFCYLTTRGRVSGRPHEIEIWFVRHGSSLFMLAGAGARSDWVQNLRADPVVTVRVRDVTYSAARTGHRRPVGSADRTRPRIREVPDRLER